MRRGKHNDAVSHCKIVTARGGTSHGPVSVSVTSRSSTKTDKRSITQTTPHDSPGTQTTPICTSCIDSHGLGPCVSILGWVGSIS